MELAISAVASDLVSRFISFVTTKLSSGSSCLEPEVKIQRLRHLVLRVETVVEEADARHITNSAMLRQLKILEDALYRGYHALDTFRFGRLPNDDAEGAVRSSSSALYFATPLKRLRRSAGAMDYCSTVSNELQSALGNLETAVANMTEFVVLLGGFERMARRPYDTYLYLENFMFGRCAEKQQAFNFLLDDSLLGKEAAAVLPIIGGRLVGKKTLVAHICNDERIRSRFSSVLHLNGDNFQKMDHQMCTSGRTLIVVEFTSDVRDEDWTEFYSLITASMTKGSKVIVISRLAKVSRFGTVRPVCVQNLTYEEYCYLFKVLSFGSTSVDDHPQLAAMVHEFPALLRGSLVWAYALADVLRRNIDDEFWLSVLTKCRNVVKNNLSVFGEHPKLLLEGDRPTDITMFASSSSGAPLRVMPPRRETDVAERSLPMVTFRDLLVDPGVLPEGEFDLLAWESKIAPYAKHVNFVPAPYAEEKLVALSARRKRAALYL